MTTRSRNVVVVKFVVAGARLQKSRDLHQQEAWEILKYSLERMEEEEVVKKRMKTHSFRIETGRTM